MKGAKSGKRLMSLGYRHDGSLMLRAELQLTCWNFDSETRVGSNEIARKGIMGWIQVPSSTECGLACHLCFYA